jgi:hypothetical protein
MKYERLTIGTLNGAGLGVHPSAAAINNRLYELENKIENGTLLELPCPIGSPVYILITKRPKITHPEFTFIKKSRLTYYNLERVIKGFGETVFLTSEEAKTALERMNQ